MNAITIARTCMREPWLRDISIGAGKLGELLERQIRIGISGKGPFAARTLTGQTQAARQWLKQPGTADTLHKLLGVVDGRAGAARISGITFSDSEAGFAANLLVDAIAWGDPTVSMAFEKALKDPGSRGQFAEVVTKFARNHSGSFAEYGNGVNFGPDISNFLLDRIAKPGARKFDPFVPVDTMIVAVAHEFEHAISHVSPETYLTKSGRTSNLGKLEEGKAQFMAMNGTASKVAKILHHRLDVGTLPPTYKPEVTAIEHYLRGSMLPDHAKDARDFAQIDDLLQAKPIQELPRRIADRLAEVRGIVGKDNRELLAQRIAKNGSEPRRAVDTIRAADRLAAQSKRSTP